MAKILNSFVSDMVENDTRFSFEDARIITGMNYGSQINGSWRNEIGEQGARWMKQILLGFLREKKVISSVELKDGRVFPPEETFNIDTVAKISLTNSYLVKFASEPDIEMLDDGGKLLVAVEIKSGLDPAAALERYGAGKKSFDQALDRNKAAETMYVGLITDRVKKLIAKDRLVKVSYEVTEIFANRDARKEFLEKFLWLAHLS